MHRVQRSPSSASRLWHLGAPRSAVQLVHSPKSVRQSRGACNRCRAEQATPEPHLSVTVSLAAQHHVYFHNVVLLKQECEVVLWAETAIFWTISTVARRPCPLNNQCHTPPTQRCERLLGALRSSDGRRRKGRRAAGCLPQAALAGPQTQLPQPLEGHGSIPPCQLPGACRAAPSTPPTAARASSGRAAGPRALG